MSLLTVVHLFGTHWTVELLANVTREEAVIVSKILLHVPESPRAGVRVLIDRLKVIQSREFLMTNKDVSGVRAGPDFRHDCR